MLSAHPQREPQVWLEELAELPRAGVVSGSKQRVAFRICGEIAQNRHGLHAGDVLVVAADADAEVGSFVVWWTGDPSSLALAEVAEGYQLRSLANFPAPQVQGEGAATRLQTDAEVLGVVLGRLRRVPDPPATQPRQGA